MDHLPPPLTPALDAGHGFRFRGQRRQSFPCLQNESPEFSSPLTLVRDGSHPAYWM